MRKTTSFWQNYWLMLSFLPRAFHLCVAPQPQGPAAVSASASRARAAVPVCASLSLFPLFTFNAVNPPLANIADSQFFSGHRLSIRSRMNAA